MAIAELTVGRFRALAERALRDAGAGAAMTASLIEATLSAERAGRPEVGIAHLPDYLASLREGRIAGNAVPEIASPLPAIIEADAKGGIAQLGFDLAFADLAACAEQFGLAVFTQRNSYSAGELGYFVRRLAEAGLVALAATNAHAMMATAAGGRPVFSTNPLAFAAPLGASHRPLVIDQASSATAFVNLARAAARNEAIPEGWAINAAGAATTDARAAVLGALLPFGGRKGGNVALMVEMLSAGLAGANWSMDAGHFRSGSRSPGVGLTVLALRPPNAEAFAERAAQFCGRLREAGVHVPGSGAPAGPFDEADLIQLDADVLKLLTG